MLTRPAGCSETRCFGIPSAVARQLLSLTLAGLGGHGARRESLDLRLTPYNVIATGTDNGMVEFVPSHTLAAVLEKHKAIAKFLALQNPDPQVRDTAMSRGGGGRWSEAGQRLRGVMRGGQLGGRAGMKWRARREVEGMHGAGDRVGTPTHIRHLPSGCTPPPTDNCPQPKEAQPLSQLGIRLI